MVGPIVVATLPPASAAATTITFAVLQPNPELIRSVETFQQAHPELAVTLKPGHELLAVMESRLERAQLERLATHADCFQWDAPVQTAGLTATLDLQPLLDADPSLMPDEYPAALLADLRDGPRLHGLPYSVGVRMLSYNQDLFEQAQVPLPTNQWRRDEFTQAVIALTNRPQRYGFATTNAHGIAYLVQIDELLRLAGMPLLPPDPATAVSYLDC